MKAKIVVLGKKNSLYTKMVVCQLKEKGIDFDLILEESKKEEASLSIISKFKRILNSGAFTSLSIFNWFTWYLLIERHRNKKNSKVLDLVSKYADTALNPSLYVDNINNDSAKKFLNDNSYEYAVFAGVGIVKNEVISILQKFCINAHPAPLPECRGGGALECTLLKGLKPSVTVHVATAGIDEGEIINVQELKLTSDENFVTVTHRLTEKCAIEISKVCKMLIQNERIALKPNGGELNYWRDWNAKKQLVARRNLKRLLRDVEN